METHQIEWEVKQKQQRVEHDSEIRKEKAAHLSKRGTVCLFVSTVIDWFLEAQSAKAHYETIQAKPTPPEKNAKRKRPQSNGSGQTPKRRRKEKEEELWV